MFEIILKNLLGYDFLIILLALVNGLYLMPRILYYSNSLHNQLHSKVYLSITVLLKAFNNNSSSSLDFHKLKDLQDKELKLYGLFSTINGIFPLMGMLGTILSLLKVISFESGNIMMNFTAALTSTFWGLLFAIFFKAFDGYIGHLVQQNEANINLLLERIDKYNERGDINEK
jgi:biopolymer transport protein ExbB